jgi:hypothetical protein
MESGYIVPMSQRSSASFVEVGNCSTLSGDLNLGAALLLTEVCVLPPDPFPARRTIGGSVQLTVPFDLVGSQADWDVAEFGGQFSAQTLVVVAHDCGPNNC